MTGKRSRAFGVVAGVVLALVAVLTTAAPAAADDVQAENLLSASEVAAGSSRPGWNAEPWQDDTFDCGAFGVMRSHGGVRDNMVRRRYASEGDASAAQMGGKTPRAPMRGVLAVASDRLVR